MQKGKGEIFWRDLRRINILHKDSPDSFQLQIFGVLTVTSILGSTRDNEHKKKHEKFCLIKEPLFYCDADRLPRKAVESPSSEVF